MIDYSSPGGQCAQKKMQNLHDVMLPHQAVARLKYHQGTGKVFVFPSPRAGRHVAHKALGLAQYTVRQDGEKPAADSIEVAWAVHDLRRTVATGLAKPAVPVRLARCLRTAEDQEIAAAAKSQTDLENP